MNKTFQAAMEREGQTIFLQWVRAIIALAVVFNACYREYHGESISETFAMLIGFIAGLYFEKGSMVVAPPSVPEPAPEPSPSSDKEVS